MSRLTLDQLKQLQNHKHCTSGTSLLHPYLQPFWKWLAKYYPQKVSPNMISIMALGINITTSFLLIYHCPTVSSNAPNWVFIISALGLFVYQTLNATKQAHFTCNLSPFNELFNQSCHSVCIVIVAITEGIAMELCDHPRVMALFCLMSYVAFYCEHWCAYIKGESRIEKFDVTEIQLFTVFLFCASALFGSSVWSRTIPVIGYPYRVIPVMCYAIGFLNSVRHVVNIVIDGGCGDNGATIADTSVISPLSNIGLIIFFGISTASQSKCDICQQHPILFLLFIGMLCAKVTNLLVIAHLTRSEIRSFDKSLTALLVIFLNQYFGSLFNEYILLWICFLFTALELVHFLTNIFKEIASFLRVSIFGLSPIAEAIKKIK